MTASADRRTQLSRAAFDVFTERGYRNSSVADVVAAAGLSHGSFYNYFKNRREILDAAIDVGLAEMAPQLETPAKLADTLEDFLDVATAPLASLHSLSVDNNKLISLIVFDACAIDDELTQRAIDIFAEFAGAAQRQIEHGIAAGYLRPNLDAEVLGEMLITLSLVVLLPAQGGAALPGGLDHVVAQVRELLRAGLANPV